MAIKFEINVDGERVALVDTVEDFEKAIDTVDRPIIAPDEVRRPSGRPRSLPSTAPSGITSGRPQRIAGPRCPGTNTSQMCHHNVLRSVRLGPEERLSILLIQRPLAQFVGSDAVERPASPETSVSSGAA